MEINDLLECEFVGVVIKQKDKHKIVLMNENTIKILFGCDE